MTDVRRSLRAESSLRGFVEPGLGALEKGHARRIDESIRPGFADSLDLDQALRDSHPDQPRWDYLVGWKPGRVVVAIESHSARDGEIRAVIEKRKFALLQLGTHLCDGQRIKDWIWLASGRNDFSPNSRAAFLLSQSGIRFVGGNLLAKHLPSKVSGAPRREQGRRRKR